MNNKQWKQKFRDILFHTPVTYLELEDFISALLNQREAEIRKETILAVLDYIEENIDLCECSSKDRCEYRRKHRFQIRQSFKEKFNITI
jgi:hypothetical protein